MVGLNAYTLCCGIICEGLNGEDYCAVKLKSNEHMTIGYLKRKGVALSPLGQKYLEEIRKYKAMGHGHPWRGRYKKRIKSRARSENENMRKIQEADYRNYL